MPKYELVVRCYADPDFRHVIAERETKSMLDRVEDGLNINLDHANYYSAIEEVDE
jgi:hypothetical protein